MKNREIRYKTGAAPMLLCHRQEGGNYSRLSNGTFLPATEGITAFAMNLLQNRSDMLEERGGYRNCGILRTEPVVSDKRDNVIYVFTQDESGMLRVVLSIPERGEAEILNENICELEERVTGSCQTGSYLVLQLSDGSLHFLHYDSQEQRYESLGRLPKCGRVSVEATSIIEKEGEIESVKFTPGISDLRSGIPVRVKSDLGRAVETAYKRVFEHLRLTGRWVQPVWVMMGVRLKDNTLLRLTEPKFVDMGMQGRERIGVQALYSATEGKWICTSEESKVKSKGYKLKLRPDISGLGVWKKLVDKLEIYVSDELDPHVTALPLVSFEQQSGTLQVNCGGLTDEEHKDSSLGSGWRLLGSLTPEREEVVLGRHLPLEKSEPEKEVAEEDSGRMENVEVLTGHGEFLHYYDGESLHTSLRGNPLGRGWKTEFSSKIKALAAQSVGGGAYTRQYIYAFSSTGIYAVTHDYSGRHTNCRPIWPEGLTDSRRVVSTPWGVWCVTDCGTLLCIKDSKCESVVTCLSGCGEIGWNSMTGELWLIPLGGTSSGSWGASMAVRADLAKKGYCPATMCSYVPDHLLSRQGVMIGYRKQGSILRLTDLSSMGRSESGGDRNEILWVSNPIITECKGLTDIEAGIYGDESHAILSAHLESEYGSNDAFEGTEDMLPQSSRMLRLKSLVASGDRRVPSVMRLLLPHGRGILSSRQNRIVVSINGYLSRFTGLTLKSPQISNY